MLTPDRRRHPRHHVEIACKIRCPETGRYLHAWTTDLSEGGTLLTVRTSRPLTDGQTIELALRDDGQVLVRREELILAQVVRSSARLDDRQILALRFDRQQVQLGRSVRAAA